MNVHDNPIVRLACTCVILLSSSLVAVESAGRPQVPLPSSWSMQYADQPAANGWDKRPFKLPGVVSLPPGKAGLWLEASITVPMSWKGSRVAAHVGHPQYAVEVFVNGASAGTIVGFGGEVDIAPLLHWDGTDSLRLFFPRMGGAAVAADPWASAVVASLSESQRAKVGTLGGAENLYLERQSPTLQVRDVWYQTFTRGFARVEPLITIWSARPLTCVRARVTLESADKPVVSEFELGDIPAGESTHTVDIPAKNLAWWSLRQPNLYRGQIAILDAAGMEIDRSNPVEFGIREFWIQGREYFLNNQQINLTLDCYGGATIKDGVTLTYSKHAANGVNLIWDLTDEATECDRSGMGLAAFGVAIGYESPDLTKPEKLVGYRRWVQEHLRNLRNHPSILLWVLSSNSAGGDIHNPTAIGRSRILSWNHVLATTSSTEHKRADPTRPVYHHSSVGTGDLDSGNIYFNHLPTQSVEDWLSEWKEYGDRPFMFIEFMGAPLLPDYLKGYTSFPMISYATEYAARLAGPGAYTAESQAYRDYANHAVLRQRSVWEYDPLRYSDLVTTQIAEAQRRAYRACRYQGVPADAWVFPPQAKFAKDPGNANLNALVASTHADLKPDLCWIGGPAKDWTDKAHHFYPGDSIHKSVLCVHDQPTRANVVVAWRAKLVADGSLVASGEETSQLLPWSRAAIEFQVKAPEVTGELEITAEVNGLGSIIHCEPFRCTIWPQPIPVQGSFAIIDPEGDTSTWLQRAGVVLKPFDPTKPQTLILGRRALRTLTQLPFTEKDIYAGLRVLVCEQYCGDLEKLGFRTESHRPRNMFIRCPSNPILTGLVDEALRDWRGSATLLGWGPEGDTTKTPLSRRNYSWSNRGSVASNIIETPQLGTFKAISDGEFDLSYTALLSWRHGKGEVVVSQFDISGRTDTDPAVERIQRNLVSYLRQPLVDDPQSRVAICAGSAVQDAITALGFAATPWSGDLDPARNILVFGKDDAAAWRKHAAVARQFTTRGGTILFFPATAEILSAAEFSGLSLQPTRLVGSVATPEANALLDGVGPQHLHWREPIDLARIVAEPGSGCQSLLGGLAGVMPRGKGRFVFLQADPAVFTDFTAVQDADIQLRKPGAPPLPNASYAKNRHRSLWQAKRLDALLLSNLGMESSANLVATLFHGKRKMPFYPVDKWMLLGPIPPQVDPLALDIAALLKDRASEKPIALASGGAVPWCAPVDFNNGLGVGGMVDLAKVYGVKERQTTVAVTYIWSTRPRLATMEIGADWWMKIQLNGSEIFRTGADIHSNMGGSFAQGFAFSVKAQLQKGWNEVICTVGSGGGGNAFWFRVSNPGDVKEEQVLQEPKDSPATFLRFAAGGEFAKMSPTELSESENAPAGFSFYADPITVEDDPYLYMRW